MRNEEDLERNLVGDGVEELVEARVGGGLIGEDGGHVGLAGLDVEHGDLELGDLRKRLE